MSQIKHASINSKPMYELTYTQLKTIKTKKKLKKIFLIALYFASFILAVWLAYQIYDLTVMGKDILRLMSLI